MKLLLDTHILLWAAGVPERLAPPVRSLLEAEEHELWFSAANLWEISIKSALGRDNFQVNAGILRRALLDNGYHEMAISSRHAVEIDVLPGLHKDPFDRILVAQALVEGFTLLTADRMLTQYPGSILHVEDVT